MAPVYALVPHDPGLPIRVALVLLALFDTAALFFLLRLVARRSTFRATPILAGLAWILHPYGILTALNALETSIAACFVAALLLAIDRLRAAPHALARPAAPFGIGLLLGIAALARIDSLLFAPVLAGLFFVLRRRAGLSWAGLAAATGVTALGALVALAPWLAYSWRWTHDLFPVSGRALRYLSLSSVGHAPTWANFYAPLLARAALVVARRNALLLALLAALAAGLPLLRVSGRAVAERLKAAAPALGFCALLFAAYTGWVFGPWHFARYLFPLTLCALLAFAALVDAWGDALAPGRARTWFAVAVAALVIAGSVAQPAFRRLLAPRFDGTWGYRRIGLWARDHFPPGALIGGSQTGALGYFADRLTVVNLDGVVNRECYDAMRAGRMLDYARRTGVRELVWQDDIELLARESPNTAPAAVTRIGRIGAFETWGAKWYLYRLDSP